MFDKCIIFKELLNNEFEILSNSQSNKTINNLSKNKVKVKNLTIIFDERHIVIRGSLSRFKFNDYTTNLTRQSTEKAICELETLLGLELSNAYVFQLELSRNIILDKPIEAYISLFDKVNYCKIKTFPNGKSIQFTNKRKSIIIYDKRFKLKKNGIELNKQYDCINTIAKVEIRIKKRVRNQLRAFYKRQKKNRKYYHLPNYEIGAYLKVKDLYDRNTYIFLNDMWIEAIKSIKTKDRFNKKLYDEFINACENGIKYYR